LLLIAQSDLNIQTAHKLIAAVLLVLLSLCEAHKILGVFPTSWKSHWKIGASVMTELANAGHDVTVISPFAIEAPNLRNVLLTNYFESKFLKFLDSTLE